MNIRGATSIPAANPLSLNPADYPACVAWFQFHSSLADKMGNIADLTLVEGVAADPWAVTRALSVNDDTAATTDVYAQRKLTEDDVLKLALPVNGKLIIEVDVMIPNAPAHSVAFIDVGQSESNQRGWMFGVDSNLKPIVRLSNDTVPWEVESTWANSGVANAALPLNTRQRVVAMIDNEAQFVRIYSGGLLNGNTQDTSTGTYTWNSITPLIGTFNSINIGLRHAASRRGDLILHNLRIWKPSNLDNMADFIAQTHQLTSDEFPPCMLGVE